MAHFAKHTASASGHLTAHYERRQVPVPGADGSVTMEYVKFGNQDIDLTRTHLNYNLAPEHPGSQIEFMHQRMSELKHQNRADLNVMCSWVVTLPKLNENIQPPYSEQEIKDFFQAAYDYLEDRYGGKNVISSYVHMDESQPHMHFAFIPAVPDKRWNKLHPDAPREKVSAKECVSKIDLQNFHKDLQEVLDGQFGQGFYPVLNGATIPGNLTIAEMKAIRDMNEISQDMTVLEQDKFHLERDVEALQNTLQKAQNDVVRAKDELLDLQGQTHTLTAKKEILRREVNEVYADLKEARIDLEMKKDLLKKIDDQGERQLTMAGWHSQVAAAKQELQKEQQKSMLAKFAEMIIDQFPAIRQLWEKFQRDENRRGLRKKSLLSQDKES